MLVALHPLEPQWDMADFTPCTYSKRQVVQAGKALAGNIQYDPATFDDALQVFRTAHKWRESNVYPMRRVRAELLARMRADKAQGITAARLKRMASIRKKLRTRNLTLYQMQDIGGCRAITNDISDFEKALRPYIDGRSRYAIVDDDDHIGQPKATGYRSRHLVLKFNDPDDDRFNRHFVELQIRTRSQHAWATAVEAVGLVRGEDLKGGIGDPKWLRLFQVMAGEMAAYEETAAVPNVSSDSAERRKELIQLNRELDALQALDSYNRAIKHTESIYSFSAPYYLIEYDTNRMDVSVRPFNFAAFGSAQYADAERNKNVNSVLVEVEKVADLREAYPNYFLDVGTFTLRLRRALHEPFKRPRIDVDWLKEWIGGAQGNLR